MFSRMSQNKPASMSVTADLPHRPANFPPTATKPLPFSTAPSESV